MMHTVKLRGRRLYLAVALCGFEAAAIVLLHRLGEISWMQAPWGSLRSWLGVAPLEDVVAAGIRSMALVIAYWVAGSTAAYGAARISRIPGLIRATAWATLPPIRRAIDRALAATFTAAALVSPMAEVTAAEIPLPPEPIVYQISDGAVPTPLTPPVADATVVVPPGIEGAGYTPQPAGAVAAEDQSDPIATVGGGGDAEGAAGRTLHEVAAGDNLWTISAAHLRSVFPDRTIDTGEIATYWRRVIEVNTAALRSGDPNLIYPGEQIELPDPGPETNP